MERLKIIDRNIITKLHELKGIEKEIEVEGYTINVESDRYDNFYAHGFKCCKCGVEGTYAAIERSARERKPHINVYGVRADGREIMLTKDHIFPVALGGLNRIENYQTMCQSCNTKKGTKTTLTIEEAAEKGYTTISRARAIAEINKEKEELNKLKELVIQKQKNLNRMRAKANLK